jgi:hypothetical protein
LLAAFPNLISARTTCDTNAAYISATLSKAREKPDDTARTPIG